MNDENNNINLDEIRKLANIIDESAKGLQTGLRNLLIAKETGAGCSWYLLPKQMEIRGDISFLRRKLKELSERLRE